MKRTFHLLLLSMFPFGCLTRASGQSSGPSVSIGAPPVTADTAIPGTMAIPAYNKLILQQIHTMPTNGGYSASHVATQRLAGSILLNPLGKLDVSASSACPSYCSGATYLVFLKAVSALQKSGQLPLDSASLNALLVSGQRDGEGIWGRWNANGPGTARLFHELALGPNFSDYARAQPGDFMKIFWNNAVGRKEHGHSVIFLRTENIEGVDSVRFWSSNIGVGYSEKTVPRSKIVFPIFSRLEAPRNLAQAASITPTTDPYLAGLLTKDSNFNEVRERCGMSIF